MRIMNKLASVLAGLALVVGLWPAVTTTAQAAVINTSIDTAQEVSAGQTVEVTLEQDYKYYYYAIETAKDGQFISVDVNAASSVSAYIYNSERESFISSSGDQYNITGVTTTAGVYYVGLRHTLGEAVNVSFTVSLLDNDEHESNNTKDTAKEVTVGETAAMTLGGGDSDWFKITTTKPGQFIQATVTASESVRTYIYGPTVTVEKEYRTGTAYTASAVTEEVGTYYIQMEAIGAELRTASLTVTLLDNDSCESNNTQESACELTSGETAEFALGHDDVDWFVVETTEPGQDILVDISGFNYANEGNLRLSYDETIASRIAGNETFYFHAAEAGAHYIKLDSGSCSTAELLKLAITAAVLDGDEHESKGNEDAVAAVTLNLGTDETFNIGGWGDEDWFQFEVAPEEESNNLYTLQFLDLNPNYSDEFYYQVYAPDGSIVADQTRVNIQHSNILACDQQGMYKVRVYSGWYLSYYNNGFVDVTRSDLRIRVSMGGNDPHESNDTWLEAKPIQVGQLVQHVLVSTSDEDWFYFTAEEADMSFALKFDKPTWYALYRAEDLAEFGTDASELGYTRSYSGVGPYYYKLDGAGVYYLRLSSETAYVSEELRSFTVTVEPNSGEENNDTWDTATPIYENAPQVFDVAGSNDTDWFKFVVPSGAIKTTLCCTKDTSDSITIKLYRERDIIQSGISTSPIMEKTLSSGSGVWSNDLAEGVYYVKIVGRIWHDNNERTTGNVLTYYISYNEDGNSIESALPLDPGVWSEERDSTTYYSLGTLSASDVVRYSRDGSGLETTVSLYNSAGESVSNASCANYSFLIPSDGEYYLKAFVSDPSTQIYTTRIRYDIGSGEEYATEIEAPDSITMKVGETRFVDLRLAPYEAVSSESYIQPYGNTTSSVATYNSYTGYLTAKALGSTDITFRVRVSGYNTYLTKTVTINVVEETAATGVSISGAVEELQLGASVDLTAVLEPDEADEDVVWNSSDTGILYVSDKGKVVAVGEGEATITASVAAGSDSVSIRVVPAELTENEITSLELDQYSLTMYMGEETQKLTATVFPEGIEAEVKWVSSNTAAAIVDQNGVITAVAPGISIITASAGDYNASCIVTVQAERVRVTGISFVEEMLQIPMGGQTTLLPNIEPYNATTKTLTWVSDDESVAAVSRTGIVNALAVGVTTIRATTLDGGFTAEITIEVTAAPQLGDINGDGYIDSADALITLRVAVGLRTLTEEEAKAADVNGDGSVDAGDGIKLLRYDAKLIDSLE